MWDTVGEASARVANTTLRGLADDAHVIAVVKVNGKRVINGLNWAEVSVVRGIKGAAAGESLMMLAEQTWTCDISDAVTGETALVFLRDARDQNTWWGFKSPDYAKLPRRAYLISWSGRGRMPVREVKQQPYVTIWHHDVEIPRGIRTIEVADPQYQFIRSFHLDDVVAKVAEYVRKAGG